MRCYFGFSNLGLYLPLLGQPQILTNARLYELLQVILQHTKLLSSMTFLSMVSVIQALIPFSRVPTHLPRPSKVRFILNVLEDLIDKLLKRHINFLGLYVKSILRTLGSFLVLC